MNTDIISSQSSEKTRQRLQPLPERFVIRWNGSWDWMYLCIYVNGEAHNIPDRCDENACSENVDGGRCRSIRLLHNCNGVMMMLLENADLSFTETF